MTKNILVLNALLCLFTGTLLHAQTEKTVYTVEEATRFLEQNRETGCTLHFAPNQGWWETATGYITAPYRALSNACSLKNVTLTVISGALSLGWVSYLLCSYIIYKTYFLLKKSDAWVNWCSDDELLSDYEALYRNYENRLRRTKRFSKKNLSLGQEKKLLKTYLQLDNVLRKHRIRHYFPYADKTLHIRIRQAYVKLQKAEKLLGIHR